MDYCYLPTRKDSLIAKVYADFRGENEKEKSIGRYVATLRGMYDEAVRKATPPGETPQLPDWDNMSIVETLRTLQRFRADLKSGKKNFLKKVDSALQNAINTGKGMRRLQKAYTPTTRELRISRITTDVSKEIDLIQEKFPNLSRAQIGMGVKTADGTTKFGALNIYDKLFNKYLAKAERYEHLGEEEKAKEYYKILDNWESLVTLSMLRLRDIEQLKIGIDGSYAAETDENDYNDTDVEDLVNLEEMEKDGWMEVAESMSAYASIGKQVRRVLAMIPAVDENGKVITDDLGEPINADPVKVHQNLVAITRGCTSSITMIKAITDAASYNKMMLKVLEVLCPGIVEQRPDGTIYMDKSFDDAMSRMFKKFLAEKQIPNAERYKSFQDYENFLEQKIASINSQIVEPSENATKEEREAIEEQKSMYAEDIKLYNELLEETKAVEQVYMAKADNAMSMRSAFFHDLYSNFAPLTTLEKVTNAVTGISKWAVRLLNRRSNASLYQNAKSHMTIGYNYKTSGFEMHEFIYDEEGHIDFNGLNAIQYSILNVVGKKDFTQLYSNAYLKIQQELKEAQKIVATTTEERIAKEKKIEEIKKRLSTEAGEFNYKNIDAIKRILRAFGIDSKDMNLTAQAIYSNRAARIEFQKAATNFNQHFIETASVQRAKANAIEYEKDSEGNNVLDERGQPIISKDNHGGIVFSKKYTPTMEYYFGKKISSSPSNYTELEEALMKFTSLVAENDPNIKLEARVPYMDKHGNPTRLSSDVNPSYLGDMVQQIQGIVKAGNKTLLKEYLENNFFKCSMFADILRIERREVTKIVGGKEVKVPTYVPVYGNIRNYWLRKLYEQCLDKDASLTMPDGFAANVSWNRLIGDNKNAENAQRFEDYSMKQHALAMLTAYAQNAENSYADYPVFILGDSGVMKFMRGPILSREEIIDELVDNVINQELTRSRLASGTKRILEDQNMPIIDNFCKNANKFSILPFFNENYEIKVVDKLINGTQVDPYVAIVEKGTDNIVTRDEIKRVIQENFEQKEQEYYDFISSKGLLKEVNGKYLYIEDSVAKRMTKYIKIIDQQDPVTKRFFKGEAKDVSEVIALVKREQGREITEEEAKAISKEDIRKMVARELVKEMYYNTRFATIEQIQLMTTDPSFYKNVVDLQKRYKEIHAPGKKLDVTAWDKFNHRLFTDRTVRLGDGNVDYKRDYNERVVYFDDISIPGSEVGVKRGSLESEFTSVMESIFGKDSAEYKEYEKGCTLTDGQGYRTLKGFRRVMGMAGKWTEEHEAVYKKILQYSDKLKNRTVSDEEKQSYIKEIVKLSTVMQPVKPYLYSKERINGFNTRKDITDEHNQKISEQAAPNYIDIPVQHKYAEVILIPELLPEGSRLRQLAELMDRDDEGIRTKNGIAVTKYGIDLVCSTKAVKVGGFGSIAFDFQTNDEGLYVDASGNVIKDASGNNPKTRDDQKRNSEFRKLAVPVNNVTFAKQFDKAYVHKLSYEDYRIQTNVPNHINHDALFGTQVRKLVLAHLKTDEGYAGYRRYLSKIIEGESEAVGVNLTGEIGGEKTLLDGNGLMTFYNQLICANILESYESFKKAVATLPSTSRYLIQQAISSSRESEDNILAYCLTGDADFLLPLFENSTAHDASASLFSIFKKAVNKQRISGGAAVQASSWGITKVEHGSDYGNLEYHGEVARDENGKVIYDSNGKPKYDNILYGDCEIPFNLHYSYVDKRGNVREVKLNFEDYCNPDGTLKESGRRIDIRAIAEGDSRVVDPNTPLGGSIVKEALIEKHFPGILDIIAYRIPSESAYSMLNLRVKRFSKPTEGGTIKVPPQGTVQAGFDFDIDKLYLMRKEFRLSNKRLSKEQRRRVWQSFWSDPKNKDIVTALKDAKKSEESLLPMIDKLLDSIGVTDEEDTESGNSTSLLNYWEAAGLDPKMLPVFRDLILNYGFGFDEYDLDAPVNAFDKTINIPIFQKEGVYSVSTNVVSSTINRPSYYEGDVTPEPNTIMVFGSNVEGRHGKGAALFAKKNFGARYGIGEGLTGNAYALPTKDLRVKENNSLRSISKEKIIESIKKLYDTAEQHPDKQFKVAYRNTETESLNGYTGIEMIEMFKAAGNIPSNIVFSKEWVDTGAFDVESNVYSSEVFNTLSSDLVETEEYEKPWKEDPDRTNRAVKIYLKGEREKGYFEVVKDEEREYYSVHFKPANKNNPKSFTKNEKAILFQAVADILPAGSKISTHGTITRGGVAGLERFRTLQSQTGRFIDTGEVRTVNRNTNFMEGNSRIARNNMLIHIIRQRLMDKETMKERFTPGGFDHPKAAARRMRQLAFGEYEITEKPIPTSKEDPDWSEKDKIIEERKQNFQKRKELIDKDSKEKPDPLPEYDYSDPMTMLIFNQQNQVAGKLIGIYANQNANTALTSLVKEYKTRFPIAFGNHISDGGLSNLMSENASRATAELLASSVDAVKDPVLNYLNLNITTANDGAVLARLGYSFEEIGALFNQPIIKDLCEYIQNTGVTFDEAVAQMKREYASSVNSNVMSSLDRQLRFSTEALESFIIEGKQDHSKYSDLFKAYQLEILNLYNGIHQVGEEVNDFINATKFSASNSVQSTFGKMIVQGNKANKYIKGATDARSKTILVFKDHKSEIVKDDRHGGVIRKEIGKAAIERPLLGDYKSYIKRVCLNNPFAYEQCMYDCNYYAVQAIAQDKFPYFTELYEEMRSCLGIVSTGSNGDVIDLAHADFQNFILSYLPYSVFNGESEMEYRVVVENGKNTAIEYGSLADDSSLFADVSNRQFYLNYFPDMLLNLKKTLNKALHGESVQSEVRIGAVKLTREEALDLEKLLSRIEYSNIKYTNEEGKQVTRRALAINTRDLLKDELAGLQSEFEAVANATNPISNQVVSDLFIYDFFENGQSMNGKSFNMLIPKMFKAKFIIGQYEDETTGTLRTVRYRDILKAVNSGSVLTVNRGNTINRFLEEFSLNHTDLPGVCKTFDLSNLSARANENRTRLDRGLWIKVNAEGMDAYRAAGSMDNINYTPITKYVDSFTIKCTMIDKGEVIKSPICKKIIDIMDYSQDPPVKAQLYNCYPILNINGVYYRAYNEANESRSEDEEMNDSGLVFNQSTSLSGDNGEITYVRVTKRETNAYNDRGGLLGSERINNFGEVEEGNEESFTLSEDYERRLVVNQLSKRTQEIFNETENADERIQQILEDPEVQNCECIDPNTGEKLC
jgi:hypothetical protein